MQSLESTERYVVRSLQSFEIDASQCHFVAQRRNPCNNRPEGVSGWENLKQQRSFFPVNASYLETSERFLRLRLRNDIWLVSFVFAIVKNMIGRIDGSRRYREKIRQSCASVFLNQLAIIMAKTLRHQHICDFNFCSNKVSFVAPNRFD